MIWCLLTGMVSSLALALVSLMVRPPRIHRIHPARAVRGCMALLFLSVALGLALLALGMARPELLALP